MFSQPKTEGAFTWTYDAAGRVISRAATSVTTVNYTYDLNGNRLTASDGTAITTTYDRLNRPTQITVAGDSAATTSYTYSFTSPTWTDASGSYTATIDKFGRETGLLDPIHGVTPWTSSYRADGRPASLAAPNGNTTAWTYDEAGRPTGSATTAAGPVTRASYAYTLNRAGQRLSESSSITGDPTNGTANFTYDALGRLTGYSGTPVTTQAFTWDKVANRLTKQVGGGSTVTMTYNNANRPTSDTAGGTYANDLDGRLTGQPAQTLVWDALGRLTQVKDPVTSANISTYTYDALDRLLTVSNGAGLTKFRYVGATTQIAQARDVNNTVLYNVGTSWAGGARMDFGAGGSNQRFYGVNGHGDLTWTGSSTGAVSATLRSDPWGIPGTSSGGALPSFRFQGSWYDTSSALSWMVSRWYAPVLGRFTSEDTLLGERESPASRHLLAYVSGEPVGRWDPDGQDEDYFNDMEKRVCDSLDFFTCFTVKKIGFISLSYARDTWVNPKRNTMRHCIWQCWMREDVGWGVAYRIGWAHERGDENNVYPYYEEMVDVKNNIVGRYLGQFMGRFWWMSKLQAAVTLCNYAWDNGWLWKYVESTNRVYWSDGRRIYTPYWTYG